MAQPIAVFAKAGLLTQHYQSFRGRSFGPPDVGCLTLRDFRRVSTTDDASCDLAHFHLSPRFVHKDGAAHATDMVSKATPRPMFRLEHVTNDYETISAADQIQYLEKQVAISTATE
ncbi:MAG: hypothetical protein M3O09_08010 [Acidobacteriota bacterium]|nr:hypothetical protein [Acidobacteriota bacterium]